MVGLSLNLVLGALYEFVREEAKSSKNGTPSKRGYDFEDRASRQIFDIVRGYGVTSRPPRTELEYPSFSGINHIFDNMFLHEKIVYPIECKAARHEVEHLYTFNAKLIDHALGFKVHGLQLHIRGIFLSTKELGESARAYAFAYGIIPIDPAVPPIDYMIESADDQILRQELKRLSETMKVCMPDILDSTMRRNGPKLEEAFTHLYRIWKAKGHA